MASRSVFFLKQKTAYEMRISDWSSDVCSSDPLPRKPAPRKNSIPNCGWKRIGWNAASPRGESAIRRSGERRVGEQCVIKGGTRWSPYHQEKRLADLAKRVDATVISTSFCRARQSVCNIPFVVTIVNRHL